MRKYRIDWYYLLNDGHILHIRSETVVVRRRMNMVLDDYGGQMIPGDECGSNFQTFVQRLRKNLEKKLNQETDSTGDRTQAGCVRGNDVTSNYNDDHIQFLL